MKQQQSVTYSCEFHTWFTCPREMMWQKSHSNVLFCCFCSESELSTSRLMVNSSEKVFRKNLPAYLQATQEGWKVNATLVGLIRWVKSFWVLLLSIIEVTGLISYICWHLSAKCCLCSQTPLLNLSSLSCLWAGAEGWKCGQQHI